jgi:hypothetical protein
MVVLAGVAAFEAEGDKRYVFAIGLEGVQMFGEERAVGDDRKGIVADTDVFEKFRQMGIQKRLASRDGDMTKTETAGFLCDPFGQGKVEIVFSVGVSEAMAAGKVAAVREDKDKIFFYPGCSAWIGSGRPLLKFNGPAPIP